MARDTQFDIVYDMSGSPLRVKVGGAGHSQGTHFELLGFRVLVRLQGKAITSKPIFSSNGINLLVRVRLSASPIIQYDRTNWVAWSKIGESSFVLDRVNDAGLRPMIWAGYVFNVLQLGNNAIIYGTNGVCEMYPSTVSGPETFATYGFKDIMLDGVKSKNAMCGDSTVHYFISRRDQLWRLTPRGPEFLDYQEFLEGMMNPSMHYDSRYHRVLISDPDMGLCYSMSGMGGGYPNLTGYAYVDSLLQVCSPGEIPLVPLELTTEIMDFNYRGLKTIQSVHVGTDVPITLQVAIDYRYDKGQPFKSTPWITCNFEGGAVIPCTGLEHRIKVRAKTYNYFAVDYLNVQMKYSDRRYLRGIMSTQANLQNAEVQNA